MYKVVVAGAIATAVQAIHPINQQIVEAIKERTVSWTAHEAHENPLKDYSPEQLMGLCGTFFEDTNEIYAPSTILSALPTNFDSRTQWGSKIHAIRDQQQCGSCWAFGASEALSDRFAIASNGSVDVVLSPEDMVSCDTTDMGCNGGYINKAWAYLEKSGIVSDACFPYTAGSGKAPACKSTCTNGANFKKYKCKAGSTVHPMTVAAIQSEIYANGPIEGAFTVYQDFFNYKSGVYHHVSGGVAGGHAIKVVGFGVENNEAYWLCANSWGTSFGISGFFKIRQGDSGINQQMYGCTPSLPAAEFTETE
jgi:cathepsin B